MAIPSTTFDELMEFETASWAVWSPGFLEASAGANNVPPVADFLRTQLDRLRPDVIFLGLNRAAGRKKQAMAPQPEHRPYANFHSVGHRGDKFLAREIPAFRSLAGGFMTDLSEAVDGNEQAVQIKDTDIPRFEEQWDTLGAARTHVICFGDKVFRALHQGFGAPPTKYLPNSDVCTVCTFSCGRDKRTLDAYKVIHYSHADRWGKAKQFRDQLAPIDGAVSAEGNQ